MANISWNPELQNSKGPKYIAIADALAQDISAGKLKEGDRLPPHRDLAYRLKVTVGTISRAYLEAEKRGLVRGEIGRGTFIKKDTFDKERQVFRMPCSVDFGKTSDTEDITNPNQGLIDFAMNFYASAEWREKLLKDVMTNIVNTTRLSPLFMYQAHRGMRPHCQAGAKFISMHGVKNVDFEQVLVCSGAQHALSVSFSSLHNPGDVIATEALTYPGVKAIAAQQSLKLLGLDMDEEGLIPEALEEACQKQNIKSLYCIPNYQNPTTTILSQERRRKIADIAEKYNLMVIEDDVFGVLNQKEHEPIANLIPHRTVFITSCSKTISPGLRVGYLLTPKAYISKMENAILSTLWMVPPFLAEAAKVIIDDGLVEKLAEHQIQNAQERQKIVRQYFPQLNGKNLLPVYHVWLPFSGEWSNSELVHAAAEKGIKIFSSEAFSVNPKLAPKAIRLCIGGIPSMDLLKQGLCELRDLINGPTDCFMSIV